MNVSREKNINEKGKKMKRIKYNRGNLASTVEAAIYYSQQLGRPVYIIPTAYGYSIDKSDITFQGTYTIDYQKSTITRMSLDMENGGRYAEWEKSITI